GEFIHFLAMHQQLAGTFWLMIPERRLQVLGNITAQQPDLAGTNTCVRFVKRDFSGAKALHLTSHQGDPALQCLKYIKAMPSLAIFRDNTLPSRRLGPCGLFLGIGGILLFGHNGYRSLRRSLLLIKSLPPPPYPS